DPATARKSRRSGSSVSPCESQDTFRIRSNKAGKPKIAICDSPASLGEGNFHRVGDLQDFKVPPRGAVGIELAPSFSIDRGDQPEETVLEGAGAVACRRLGAALGVRVVAAEDLAAGAAQLAQQRDVLRRIEFETIGLVRQVGNRMNGGGVKLRAVAEAFDEPAAFARERHARFAQNPLAQRI
ncbi:MAG TPA: hypothetical protein VIM02_00015, partial [Rhizomicrobium sp.]